MRSPQEQLAAVGRVHIPATPCIVSLQKITDFCFFGAFRGLIRKQHTVSQGSIGQSLPLPKHIAKTGIFSSPLHPADTPKFYTKPCIFTGQNSPYIET
jgi:hypothetical protein